MEVKGDGGVERSKPFQGQKGPFTPVAHDQRAVRDEDSARTGAWTRSRPNKCGDSGARLGEEVLPVVDGSRQVRRGGVCEKGKRKILAFKTSGNNNLWADLGHDPQIQRCTR